MYLADPDVNQERKLFQVSLRFGSHHMCGGTIIDSQWILTAAHCFEDTTHSYWTVATGIHDRGHIYRSQVHNVRNVIVPTGYSSRSNHNDIALIKLDKPLDLTDSTTKAVCLPNKIFRRTCMYNNGWGALHTDGPGTRLLNEVDVPIMDSNRCKYYLGNVIYGSYICAGYNQGGRDACQGDSGGPLVCKMDSFYKITGVVSWGYGCAKRHAPGVCTRVSSFIDWINTNKARHP